MSSDPASSFFQSTNLGVILGTSFCVISTDSPGAAVNALRIIAAHASTARAPPTIFMRFGRLAPTIARSSPPYIGTDSDTDST